MKVRSVATPEAAIARTADFALTTIYEQWRHNLAAHLVLTGGSSGVEIARVIAAGLTKARPKVLHLWFTDERFVEYTNIHRSDTPIIEEFASVGCTLIVHRFGTPSQGDFLTATKLYATELETKLGDEPFTTVVLSMGEDGHIASIFPNRNETAGDVLAVEDAPKWPPLRLSLSLNRLTQTYECLLLALGESKSEAIHALLNRDTSLPATLLAMRTSIILITDQPIDENVESISK